MPNVHYYREPLVVTDLALVGAGVNGLNESLNQFLKSVEGNHTLEFLVKSNILAQATVEVVDIVVNDNEVSIAEATVDATVGAVIGAILGATSLPAGAVILAVATTSILYSSFLEDDVNNFLDDIFDNPEVDMQVFDGTGNLLGGAIFSDGLHNPFNEPESSAQERAILNLLSNPAIPDVGFGSEITFSYRDGDTPPASYTIINAQSLGVLNVRFDRADIVDSEGSVIAKVRDRYFDDVTISSTSDILNEILIVENNARSIRISVNGEDGDDVEFAFGNIIQGDQGFSYDSIDDVINANSLASSGPVLVLGNGGEDEIVGRKASTNYLFGDGGDDVITGGIIGDIIYGGADNDTIIGSKGGGEIIDGGEGEDSIDYSDLGQRVAVSLNQGGAIVHFARISQNQFLSNIENIRTGSGNDTIVAAVNDNVIGSLELSIAA